MRIINESPNVRIDHSETISRNIKKCIPIYIPLVLSRKIILTIGTREGEFREYGEL